MLGHHTLPSLNQKKSKRVGRGNASGGNYSGRGMKGQRSRSGGKGGLKLRGVKQSVMKLAKVRGFKSLNDKPQIVNLSTLEKQYDAGTVITPALLATDRLIDSATKPVKILARGTISKAFTVQTTAASTAAVNAIVAAGGTFTAV